MPVILIFFVEIFVTHRIDDAKLEKLKAHGISTIEIDLSDIDYSITEEELSDILLGDNRRKYWKPNAYADKYLKDLQEEEQCKQEQYAKWEKEQQEKREREWRKQKQQREREWREQRQREERARELREREIQEQKRLEQEQRDKERKAFRDYLDNRKRKHSIDNTPVIKNTHVIDDKYASLPYSSNNLFKFRADEAMKAFTED